MAPAAFRYNWEHSAFLCASLHDLLRKVPRNQDLLWRSLQTLASGSFPLKSGVYIAENQQFNGQKLPAAPEYGVMVLPKAEITQILSLTKAVFLRRGLFGWLGLFLPQTISVTLLIPLPLRVLHRTSWRDDTEEGEGAYQLEASQINFEMRTFPQGVVLCETAFKTCWRREVCFPILLSTHRNS